jgi:protein-tyrosine-phosphatase
MQDMWQARSAAAGLVHRPARFAAHCLGWLWSFRRVAIGREHHGTLVLDDPRPGLRELRSLLLRRRPRRAGSKRASGTNLSEYLQRRLRDEAGRDIEIMFVCQGNINRSSYAELQSKQLFGAGPLRFSSAGMLPRNRRGSPAVAIEAAARRGIDMSTHRSRHAGAALLAAADVIVVFDEINLNSISARYPDLDRPVFLLGEVGGAEPQILDPEGKDEHTFDSTYDRIDACLKKLALDVCVTSRPMQEPAEC